MKTLTLLFVLFLLSANLQAATCTPQINDKKVLVQLVNETGAVIYSEQLKVKTKKKYDGLITSAEALKALTSDKSNNLKIKKPKSNLYPAGKITKISRTDGTVLATIGGCPVSKLKFFKRADKKNKTFIHESVIKLAAKNSVSDPAPSNNKSADSVQEKINETKKRVSRKLESSQAKTKQIASNTKKPSASEKTSGGTSVKGILEGLKPLPAAYIDPSETSKMMIGFNLSNKEISNDSLLNCNGYFHDKYIPSSEAQSVQVKYSEYTQQFVELSNVRINEKSLPGICLFSAIKITSPPKTKPYIARASYPVDIVGLKIGMSPDQVISVLNARNIKYNIIKSRNSDNRYSKAHLKGLDFMSSITASSPDKLENISISFAEPPAINFVNKILRSVQFKNNELPLSSKISDGLKSKYGPPSFDMSSHATYLWSFNENNVLNKNLTQQQLSLCYQPKVHHAAALKYKDIYQSCGLIVKAAVSSMPDASKSVTVTQGFTVEMSDLPMDYHHAKNTQITIQNKRLADNKKSVTEIKNRQVKTDF